MAFVLLAAVSSPLRAQAGTTIWVARYNGPGDFLDVANDVAVSPDSSVAFVTGLSDAPRGSGRYPLYWADFATIAYDPATGSELWARRYDGPAHGWDNARSLALSPDGTRVFVTGGSRGKATSQDFATVAYDASSGATLWTARYDGPAHRMDSARSVAVSEDGSRVFVSGWSIIGQSHRGRRNVYATVAYDAATGQQEWVSRSDLSGGVNYLWDSAVLPSGEAVIVTGWGQVRGVPTAAETVAYDAATGRVLWAQRADGARAGYGETVSPDGGTLYVTEVAARGFGTIAYDSASGAVRWQATFQPATQPHGGFSEAWAVAVSPDGGRVYVTGNGEWRRRQGCYYNDDYATVAYDASSGEEAWVARYSGPGGGTDVAQDVATSPDGATVYVTGESSGFGGPFSCVEGTPRTGQDYGTVAYDAATGKRLWVERYDSPKRQGKYDSAHALTVGPDGSVYVTGESHGGGYRDFATIAYSTT